MGVDKAEKNGLARAVRAQREAEVVLFDLDDTVFDHGHSRLHGLTALQRGYPELREVPLALLEREHDALLRSDYGMVLDGAVTLAESRTARIAKLLAGHGIRLGADEAERATDLYAAAYRDSRRAVPGVEGLLSQLAEHAKLGILTNGLEGAQMDKLAAIGLDRIFDSVVVSERVGRRKPEREIFEHALAALRVAPAQATYVGDSWEVDILPARSLGMRAVWLNRYGMTCPDASLAREIKTFEGADYRLFL